MGLFLLSKYKWLLKLLQVYGAPFNSQFLRHYGLYSRVAIINIIDLVDIMNAIHKDILLNIHIVYLNLSSKPNEFKLRFSLIQSIFHVPRFSTASKVEAEVLFYK